MLCLFNDNCPCVSFFKEKNLPVSKTESKSLKVVLSPEEKVSIE